MCDQTGVTSRAFRRFEGQTGLWPKHTKKLLTEKELTLAKANEIAQEMEATERNAQQLKNQQLKTREPQIRQVLPDQERAELGRIFDRPSCTC